MGLHTGRLIGGIIGRQLPRYRLFGDTVNVAARSARGFWVWGLGLGFGFRQLPRYRLFGDTVNVAARSAWGFFAWHS